MNENIEWGETTEIAPDELEAALARIQRQMEQRRIRAAMPRTKFTHRLRTLSGRKPLPLDEFEVKWTVPEALPAIGGSAYERTGDYYQQEFPAWESRPLLEHERALSAARGEIRRARRAKRRRK